MNDRLAEVVGKIGLHEHLCLMYSTQEEQFSATIPFLKIGLERGEKCIYIADTNATATVANALRVEGIDVDAAIRRGSLTITGREIYPETTNFDPDRMIEFLGGALNAAKSAGYAALRVTDEMTWVTRIDPRPEQLIEYEAKFNHFLRDYDVLGICQYDRKLFPPEVLLEIIRTHPTVVCDGWVCENPYFVPPDEFLKPRGAEREIERMLARMQEDTARNEKLRQSEALMRESEERYRKLVDILPAAVYVCDSSGRIQQFNKAAAEMWGREPSIGPTGEQFCGSYRLRSPDYRPMPHNESPMAEVLRTGLPVRNAELVIEKPNGSFVAVVANVVPLHNQEGQVAGAINCVYDISERKRAEEQLRESEADLAEAQRVAKLGSWKFNPVDDSVTWSEEVYRIFDVDKAAFGGVYESFLSNVHPEDRARVLQTNKTARESGGPFEIEYRIETRAGAVKNVREVGYVKKDANGDVLRLFGTVQDITEYRRAQEELQKLSGRLLRLQDEERQRIARDLHDATGQNLVALATMLGQLRQFLPSRARKSSKLLSECQGLADKCIREIRTLSYVLHPPALDQAGLTGAIRDYVKGFSKRSGIQVELELSVRVGRMAREAELALFRVVQEALTNIQRHSGSQRAKIRMTRDSSNLTLEIMDSRNKASGRPARPTREPHFQLGVGIPSMQERVNSIGGRFEIESTSHGTIVRVTLPVGDEREKTAHTIG